MQLGYLQPPAPLLVPDRHHPAQAESSDSTTRAIRDAEFDHVLRAQCGDEPLGALRDHLPVIHDRHPVTELLRLFHVVR